MAVLLLKAILMVLHAVLRYGCHEMRLFNMKAIIPLESALILETDIVYGDAIVKIILGYSEIKTNVFVAIMDKFIMSLDNMVSLLMYELKYCRLEVKKSTKSNLLWQITLVFFSIVTPLLPQKLLKLVGSVHN